jgi:RimJ/RimL family protein N-acetyltransferase
MAEGVGDPMFGYAHLGWADRVASALHVDYLNLGRRNLLAAEVRETQLERALAFAPDLAAVVCGGNDLMRPDHDPVAVERNVDAIVAALRAAGSDVIMFAPFDMSRSELLPADRKQSWQSLIERMGALAEARATRCRPKAQGGMRRVTLRDGRVVHVRPLERSDREGLAAAVERLSDQTRYLRFAAAKPRLTNRELDFLVDVDHHRHEAIVAIDPTTGRGVAAVRYVQLPGEPEVAEIAATVTDDWQGRGLGTALLTQLAARAREEGYSALRASVLASNQRSIAMLLAAGFAPLATSGILREYQLALR